MPSVFYVFSFKVDLMYSLYLWGFLSRLPHCLCGIVVSETVCCSHVSVVMKIKRKTLVSCLFFCEGICGQPDSCKID